MRRIPTGTRIRLCNITDPNDIDLNGRVGTIAANKHRFENRSVKLSFGDVGAWLDTNDGYSERVNIQHGEYEEVLL